MTPPNQFMENIQPKKKKLYYNHPYHFSYADLIAGVFISLFVGVTIYAAIIRDNFLLEIIKILVAPIITILGGYFGQQIASSYFMSKSPNNMNMYGYGMGYDPYGMNGMYGQTGIYTNPTLNNSVDTNVTQQNNPNGGEM